MGANPDTLAASSVYGRNLGHKFGAEDAPFILTRSLKSTDIAITELYVDRPLGRLCDPIPRVDAYMICLMLRDLPNNLYWEDGRQVSANSLKAGQITLHDLKREPLAVMDKPIHSLLFYLPCAALGALADEVNVPRISELRYEPGEGIFDKTVEHIGLTLLPALQTPECTNRLFTDHLTLALAAHTAQSYGGMQAVSRPLKGGLAPWQEKRSKEMISGDLTGATPLREIAAACGLSVSHFSRAFRRSTGLAPHTWLLEARVEAAKAMMRRRDAALPTIARACGFADQSHLCRVFTRRVGSSPGVWRKVVLG
ncbi:helix-turn-helix transcriptional regulator [Mesorhizobium sp. B1-1-8]|uniref:helix-turn-helix transcriptional regulator n=1 Tax=Mesorhizobium sp. B1-1-8 TaxID=2589976 RepID=UPI001D032AB8|nr:helix-turn-helix transcriptional regulator [Mesorhizobium sp. B1-1-8]UCI05172.1 helix-turn-helix transcriptional regulator [Mesorhizobium sp. B1-1-8]